jgi:hypothetical protein
MANAQHNAEVALREHKAEEHGGRFLDDCSVCEVLHAKAYLEEYPSDADLEEMKLITELHRVIA